MWRKIKNLKPLNGVFIFVKYKFIVKLSLEYWLSMTKVEIYDTIICEFIWNETYSDAKLGGIKWILIRVLREKIGFY